MKSAPSKTPPTLSGIPAPGSGSARVKTALSTIPPGKESPRPGNADGPVVLIDSREQKPLEVGRFLPTLTASLYSGDYSLLGFEHEIAIERKSIADLTGSLVGANRDRFEHELLRLRGMRFRRLLVVGSPAEIEAHRYRSKITPSSVFGSLAAYEARFDLPVVWEPCPDRAARLVARWAHYFFREQVRAFQKVATCTIGHAAGASTLQVVDAK